MNRDIIRKSNKVALDSEIKEAISPFLDMIEAPDLKMPKIAIELSSDQSFCLRYITLLRKLNKPYYSHNYWRFFEGCVSDELLKIAFPDVMRTLGLNTDVKTNPDVLSEFFKDHWFALLN